MKKSPKDRPAVSNEAVKAQSDKKEKECTQATKLSPNLNEAVEKSIVKSSSDEAKPEPR